MSHYFHFVLAASPVGSEHVYGRFARRKSLTHPSNRMWVGAVNTIHTQVIGGHYRHDALATGQYRHPCHCGVVVQRGDKSGSPPCLTATLQ